MYKKLKLMCYFKINFISLYFIIYFQWKKIIKMFQLKSFVYMLILNLLISFLEEHIFFFSNVYKVNFIPIKDDLHFFTYIINWNVRHRQQCHLKLFSTIFFFVLNIRFCIQKGKHENLKKNPQKETQIVIILNKINSLHILSRWWK